MKKLNVGIIGMGFIGELHFATLSMLPNVKIKALCVSRREKIKEIQEYYGVEYVTDCWEEIVNDPSIDVIHNCTPNHLHDKINLAVIAAGKHIYAEKPLSSTGENAYQVWKTAEQAGIAHGVNYQYRMNAAVIEMKNRIRSGQGGMPLFVSGQYLQDSAARRTDYTKRRIPETSPARAVLDIGVHWADTASFVMGCPIKKVYAKMYTHYPVRMDPVTKKEIKIHSDDTTSVMVEFEDGTPGQALFSKCMLGHKNDFVVTVSGEEREYSWRQEQCDRLWVGNREIGNETVYLNKKFCDPLTASYISLPAGHAFGWRDALVNAMRDFYCSVSEETWKSGKHIYATFEDGWRGNCFVEACLESERENRWSSLKGETDDQSTGMGRK